MRAEADAGPVRGLLRVREWIAIFDKGGDKFVREVGMRTAVAGALREGQVLLFVQIVTPLVVNTRIGFGKRFA